MREQIDHETGVPHNSDTRERSDLPFPVVGLGASAGGLIALKQVLGTLPRDSGMCFVVILHLSPKHESSADKVLQMSTPMPVIQVTEPTPLEANHVYVISPALDLSMSDGHLAVSQTERPRGHHVAIDLSFARSPTRTRARPSAWCSRVPAPTARSASRASRSRVA